MTSPTPRVLCDDSLHLAVGIEDTFVPQVRAGHRALDEYELTGHYAHWREDIDLAAGCYLEPLGLAELRKTDEGELARVKRPVFQRFRELAAAHGAGRLSDAEVIR